MFVNAFLAGFGAITGIGAALILICVLILVIAGWHDAHIKSRLTKVIRSGRSDNIRSIHDVKLTPPPPPDDAA